MNRVYALASSALLTVGLSATPIGGYLQINLVSSVPGMAATTDPDLVNPWGLSFSSGSPIWISDNGTGKSTLYNGAGVKQGLVVSMPAGGTAITGQVFSNIAGAFNSDLFIFASEDGTIDGWRGALGANAEVLSSSSSGAVYKGLAIGNTGGNNYLYAADFHNNQIFVLPQSGAPALAGNFTDPNLPAGFAPFNIQNLGGQLYVTYARQDATGHDDVPGAGNGFVDVFNLNGTFVKRLVTQGVLDSPWGLAIAPAGFGGAAGALLVGNFGDGTINAFDLTTGTLIGTIADLGGNPLVNDGLWGLAFGNGANQTSTNKLYITAGLNNEADGLFASISAVPEPWTAPLVGAGLALVAWSRRRRSPR